MDEGEDIDILISDQDLPAILEITNTYETASTPIDIYTPSGTNDTGWRGSRYFPEQLSIDLLSSSIFTQDLFRVPNDEFHFLSMAYHVVFHKGDKSGLPITEGIPNAFVADHDYAATLGKLFERVHGTKRSITLENLFEYLREGTYFPSADMMEIVVRHNTWVRGKWLAMVADVDFPWSQISVFIIREAGQSWVRRSKSILNERGFNILWEGSIDESNSIAGFIRGGNWGQGPYPRSGGRPVYFFVALDVAPNHSTESLSVAFPTLSNSREYYCKLEIRESFNQAQQKKKRCNIVHSSDNGLVAKEYADLLMADAHVAVIENLSRLFMDRFMEDMNSEEALLSIGRRSIVTLAERNGTKFVRKTFRPGKERFLRNEIWARSTLCGLPGVLPIEQVGSNWLLFPYADGQGLPNQSLTPPDIKKIRYFLSAAKKRGVYCTDFKPSNVLRTADGKIFFSDFEYFRSIESETWPGLRLIPVPSRKRVRAYDYPATNRSGYYARQWAPFVKLPKLALEIPLPEKLLEVGQAIYPQIIRGKIIASRTAKRLKKRIGRSLQKAPMILRKTIRRFKKGLLR